MKRDFASIAALSIALLAIGERPAHAAEPTTADCLAASDASILSANQHKLRSERSQLLVCAAPSCPADIRKECVHRVDEVNAQIPTIIFQVKDSTGADLTGVKVTMDGEALVPRLEGAALSVDPGEHSFKFEAAGQAPLTKKFIVQEGQKDRRELVALRALPAVPAPLSPAPPPPPPTRKEGLGTQKVIGLVAGGVGIVGLGLGTAFGIVAMSQKSAAQNVCPSGACPTQDGSNQWSNAASTGNISTIAFIVGGVAVAGGAVLWFTAPRASRAQVGLGLGGLHVKGSW